MNRKGLLITLVISLALVVPASPGSQALSPQASGQPATLAPQSGGMPPPSIPAKPLPHHEPGRPSNAGDYVTQVTRLNDEGLEETVELHGLEALMADGLDPLVGNYRLVEQEDVMFSMFVDGQLGVQTRRFEPGNLALVPNSVQNLGGYTSHAATAGDLNGDLLDEQIVAWIDSGTHRAYLATGAMPGTDGLTTSAPAALARSVGSPNGYALQFDGENDIVDGGGDIVELTNHSFTVAFWTRRDTAGRVDIVVAQGHMGPANYGLHIGFRDNDKFTCAFWANDLDTPTAYTDTDWHHWACTYDAGTKVRTIYRDGGQVAQDDNVDPYQGSGGLWIGRYLDGAGYAGLIDKVGIWDEARTPQQIQADVTRPEPDNSHLVAYWPFDEGAGTQTADATGHGHTGTLSGPPDWVPLGDLHLLVRGYDEALWHCAYDLDSGACLDWSNAAGGILASAPAVVSRGPNRFDLFAVGTDNQVYQRQWNSGAWSGDWVKEPDPPLSLLASMPQQSGARLEWPAPAAVARDGDQLDLFRLGPDNALRWRHSDDGSTWAAWDSLGGLLASGPGAVLLADGRVQVFAVGVDQALWYLLSEAEGTGWEMDGPAYNWQRVGLDGMDGMDPGVTPVSAPTAVQLTPGVVTVFVRGSDDALWQVTYDGAWSAWSQSGGELASRPAAAIRGDGGVELFAQAADGRLVHSGDGTTWGDLANSPWLPACCLESPVDAGAAYVYAWPDPWEYAHNIDVTTAHLSGDGREQIVLAYEADPGSSQNPTAIEVAFFDRADGLSTEPKGSILVHGPGREELWPGDRVVNPEVTVGDFDDDPGLELALVYATNRGAVTLFEHMESGSEADMGRSPSWNWDEDWTEDPSVGHLINLTDYGLNDVMSGISVADGWSATVYVDTGGGGDPFCFDSTPYVSFTGDSAFLQDEASSIRIRHRSCPGRTGAVAEPAAEPSDLKARIPFNAHFVLDLYDVDYYTSDDDYGWTLTLKSRDMWEAELRRTEAWPVPVEPDWVPKIVSGDFYGEVTTNTATDPVKEELAVVLLENLTYICDYSPNPLPPLITTCFSHRSRFQMFDYQDTDFSVRRDERFPIQTQYQDWSYGFWEPFESFLAAGDLDGDGMDEVARTWPTDYSAGVHLVIERALQIMEDNIDDLYVPPALTLSPDTEHAWRDALAVGHIGEGLDESDNPIRDPKEKIIFYEGGRLDGADQSLEVYEYDGDAAEKIVNRADIAFGDEQHYVLDLVPGDFRGESLRVGPPAYRRQDDIDTVVAIIHAPPKHYDVVDGVIYNINKDFDDTYAMLRRSEGLDVAATLSTTRIWAVDSEYEGTIGDPDGTHLSGSLENTYGEGFSKTYASFEQVLLTSEDHASADDFVVTAKTGYGVWEYPVYGAGSPAAPDGALSLVFPLQSPAYEFHPANSCDNWWYLPRHQLANVWSYPPPGTVFPEEAEEILSVQNYNAHTDSGRTVVFTGVEETKLSESVNFAHASENEYQIGGDKVTFNITPGGIGMTYHTRTPSFRWSTQRSYSDETLSTLQVQTTNETRVEIHNQAIADAAWDYNVQPFIYWADEGYMVLDYTDDATGSAFTQPTGPYYGKPDPAFLLPWMNGSDYACPAWQQAFSRDIVVYPPVVSPGDTVTVTASVRNFSNWTANGIEVAFYQGDPDAGGVFLGYGEREGAQTMDLGPRKAKSMSLSWQPTGYGQQRIYAVIDPDDDLDEVHDQTDPAINNNVGYGLLTMGAFDFVDMGLASRQTYYPLGYTTAGGLGVTAYVPTAVLSETVRAELTDATGLPGVLPGNTFELTLYAGTTGWDTELTGDTLPLSPGGPPLVLALDYAGIPGAGSRAADLTLYHLGDDGWAEATCPGYQSYRFPDDSLIAVPVCQTGVFVLAGYTPSTEFDLFLPLVFKNAP